MQTDVHTQTIIRNQALRPVHAWFKNLVCFKYELFSQKFSRSKVVPKAHGNHIWQNFLREKTYVFRLENYCLSKLCGRLIELINKAIICRKIHK